MTVFRVYIQDPLADPDYTNQFLGTAKAGEVFHNYWQDGKPQDTYETFIHALIYTYGLWVTYGDGNAEYKVDDEDGAGGTGKKLRYYDSGANPPKYVKLVLKADQDNFAGKKINMAVPSLAVDPTNLQYLDEALSEFQGKGTQGDHGDSINRAALLGMLLLKRCR